ncbi:glycoprotein with ribonuclease inhibitor domain (yddK) (modular protein) [Shigella sonnei]|nr:glycoprotein with ribonuclease inhibitor domain (yddK) (modular protein) [Shigella sonnei]
MGWQKCSGIKRSYLGFLQVPVAHVHYGMGRTPPNAQNPLVRMC